MISAKVVADSTTPTGERLTTLEVVFPRYILAEFNTHRMLSKNSASSRAIPFKKMVNQVKENPFIPYAWQRDHKGMQGDSYITNEQEIYYYNSVHETAMNLAIEQAEALNDKGNGVTKQLANRYLEPFMYHKVLVSATEWENFFNLRCPQYTLYSTDKDLQDLSYKSWKDLCNAYDVEEKVSPLKKLQYNKGQADIHMMFLAEAIYDAMNESTPKELEAGEWHIPYGDNIDIGKIATLATTLDLSISEIMQRVSISRCARLSYQTLGDNPVIDYEKDLELFKALSTSGHWSPFEHVAKVMNSEEYLSWIKGDCPLDESNERAIYDDSVGWCRNFKGFIQYRAELD